MTSGSWTHIRTSMHLESQGLEKKELGVNWRNIEDCREEEMRGYFKAAKMLVEAQT